MIINREGTKKILKLSILSIIVLFVIIYAIFNSHDFISGPKIIIESPENGSTINSSIVEIKGKALRIQNISLNNRPILIDQEGNFIETLLLSSGYNAFLFTAQDRFNRQTEYKLELLYKNSVQ